jgi:hypothetical protein
MDESRLFKGYPGYILTSPFGMRYHPVDKVNRMHNGVDVVATADGETGQVAKIKAHTGGIVDGVGYDKDAGNFVKIRVDLDTIMVYYHLRDKSSLAAGEVVQTGQIIGTMGNTGKVTNKHLHFGIKHKGQWIDPAPYLDADYLVETPKEEPGTYGTVTCSGLNIRSKASADSRIVGALFKGDWVKILQITTASDGLDWGRTEKGWVCLTGYVELETVEPNEDTFTLELRVLRKGCKGEDVKALQRFLRGCGYTIDVNGSYGYATENAVECYQEENDLLATGVVDKKTMSHILGLE